MRPRHRADAVEGVAHVRHPVAQRVVHRVLERAAPRRDGDHLGPQKPHAEHVRRLPLHVMRAHVDHALQPELRADGGRRHAVLARARLCDDARLAHPPGKDDLAQHVVDLVRARVVELVALHVDLRAAQMRRQPLGMVKRRRAAHVMRPEVVHLGPERGIGLGLLVFPLEVKDQRHQRLADEPPAEDAEAALLVRAGHVAVDDVLGHVVLRDAPRM